MFYGWEPLRDISRPGSLMFSKYIQAYTAESTDTLLTDAALECISLNSPDLVFLYMVETDEKGGHDRSHGSDAPEDITIPIFFIGDAFESGKRLENITILDIAPTITDILQILPAREWEGQSLLKSNN